MWAEAPLTGLAIATTGPDPATARLIAVATRTVNDGTNADATFQLVSTPAPIPATSSRIHGITDTSSGVPLAQALADIEQFLAAEANTGRPVVMFNHEWILDVLTAEAARENYPLTIPDTLLVIDPLIIDIELTPRRRAGKRTLPALCHAWGVDTDRHGHPVDNVNAALRLAWRIGTRHPKVRDLTAADLVAAQRSWRAADLQGRVIHFASRGKEHLVMGA